MVASISWSYMVLSFINESYNIGSFHETDIPVSWNDPTNNNSLCGGQHGRFKTLRNSTGYITATDVSDVG